MSSFTSTATRSAGSQGHGRAAGTRHRRRMGRELVRGWDHWIDDALRVGDMIGAASGGRPPGEVAVSDSTTVNIYKLADAALTRPTRQALHRRRARRVSDRPLRPRGPRAKGTAWHCAGSTAIRPREARPPTSPSARSRTSHSSCCRWSTTEPPHSPIWRQSPGRPQVGALMLWDLSHAVGAVPIDLESGRRRSGRGLHVQVRQCRTRRSGIPVRAARAPGDAAQPHPGLVRAARHVRDGSRLRPRAGHPVWLAGTPGILAVAAVEEGVRLTAEAGMTAIRQKSTALTEFGVEPARRAPGTAGLRAGQPARPTRDVARTSRSAIARRRSWSLS